MSQKISKLSKPGALIRDIVSNIKPYDALEHQHIQETLAWINEGKPLFRFAQPDIPPKHLVCYFVLLDEAAAKILLVDHKGAQLWLPTGGHVEIDEHPPTTVRREAFEELKIKADFWHKDPVFLTSTLTVGLTPGHTDITLWYVIRGNYQQNYHLNEQEFYSIQWFGLNEIVYEKSDPHMQRFVNKLRTLL